MLQHLEKLMLQKVDEQQSCVRRLIFNKNRQQFRQTSQTITTKIHVFVAMVKWLIIYFFATDCLTTKIINYFNKIINLQQNKNIYVTV
jgi:hypothetical protein